MNNVKKYWIISGTLVFVILSAFLIVEIYTSTLEDEKSDYKLQQLEMAKNAASGISYFIDHLANDIKFLSGYPEIRDLKLSSLNFPGELEANKSSGVIRSLFLTDKNGQLLISAGENIPPWAEISSEKAVRQTGRLKNFVVSEVSRNNQTEDNEHIYFQIMVPVINISKDTAGYLGYLIDFNSLVDQYIKPLKLSKEDFAWIIDSEGRLIYHPHHEEMLFFSINNTEGDCFDCHVSFDMQQKILNGTSAASGEYQVIKNEPSKVIASFPIQIQDQKWVLVLSAFVPKVTESLRERFKIFFILGFVILGVIIFFSLILYFVNLRRIRAEEARKNIEQVQVYQEQLNQVSKLASIGELVDSVAHEINTPAGIIAAHADGILLSNQAPEDLNGVMQLIKRQTQRISDYTRSLLNYSQRIPFNPGRADIKYILDECIYLLGHKFRARQILIDKSYDENIPEITADYRQVEQVLLNVINNAVDASRDKGKISFSIKASHKENPGVILKIKDEGSGIPPDNIDKIFNPFFSTKLNSNGTGLGLSIAKAIMQRHNGTITVQSKEGSGTTFTIFFPQSPEVNS